ncbi:hypothetical protein OF83DRAFT_1170899 [Amylostereum chailletii]|nr:hypothetical protein OF83DRAFT_1170899 [Amylostereum chailletii]
MLSCSRRSAIKTGSVIAFLFLSYGSPQFAMKLTSFSAALVPVTLACTVVANHVVSPA